jgi:hypothetical protein
MEISLFLGVLIGIVLGLTGAGGGVLAVPALVAGMGWSMQQAAPVALIAVAGSAALGAAEALRRGLVRYKAAGLMVLCGLPFTKVGVTVAHLLPQQWLLGIFAVVILIVAVRLLRHTMSPKQASHKQALARIDPDTGRLRWIWPSGFLFAGVGAITGFMTGLLGVGGGFVIIPAMRRYTEVPVHGIVATSLLVIALVGGGGGGVDVLHGAQLPMPATILFAISTALGLGVGRTLSSRLSEITVQRLFALVLIVAAASLMIKAAYGL